MQFQYWLLVGHLYFLSHPLFTCQPEVHFIQENIHKRWSQSPRAEVTPANVFCAIPGSGPRDGKELTNASSVANG